MTAYFNPHTRKLETPEEMGKRPADSETVLPVELVGLEGLKEIIQDAGEGPTAEEWAAYFRKVAADLGITDVERYLPSAAPDSPPPRPPRPAP